MNADITERPREGSPWTGWEIPHDELLRMLGVPDGLLMLNPEVTWRLSDGTMVVRFSTLPKAAAVRTRKQHLIGEARERRAAREAAAAQPSLFTDGKPHD